jgi:hypothetical protein
LKIILAGCLIAALTYIPLFHALAHYVNPALEAYSEKTPISVAANNCSFHLFVGPWSKFSDCDRAKDFLTKQGLSFKSTEAAAGEPLTLKIGDKELKGAWDEKAAQAALKDSGYPGPADKNQVNYGMAVLILFTMLIYVTMVYGPIAAYLVELFPTRIRYTSMSLPYHIGNGWFGGMLPLTATAIVAATGNIYYGLWYPTIVAAFTLVIGALFLHDTKGRDLHLE